MHSIVITRPLALHRGLMPLVAGWFASEWPDWYGPGGQGNVIDDIEAFATSESSLPIGMIIFENDIPVGAGALKMQSIPSHKHLSPWAAAGYVVPACRGRGLGASMLDALVSKAKTLGFEQVYCATSTAERLLTRTGWQTLEVIVHAGKQLTIFRSAA